MNRLRLVGLALVVLSTAGLADWEISSSRIVSNQLVLQLSGVSSTDTYTFTSSSSLFSNDWNDLSVRLGASNELSINLTDSGFFVSARYSSLEDADDDLILNQDEYGQGTDPEDADSDDDHVSDAADANPAINTDSDSDGLGDDWEDYWFGDLSYDGDDDPDGDNLANSSEYDLDTYGLSADSDLDWASDGFEVQEVYDPLASTNTPPLRFIVNDDGLYQASTNFTLSFTGLVADVVIIGTSTSLIDGVTNTFESSISYSLADSSNGWREMFAKLQRDGTTESSIIREGFVLDTIAPTVTITNETTTSRRWINVEGSATDNVSAMTILVNGEYPNGVSSGRYEYSKFELTNGTNGIIVTATDRAGNATTQQVEVIQDTSSDVTAPSISLNLNDGANFGSNETLHVEGSTDDETAEVLVSVENGNETNGPFSFNVSGTQVWGSVELFTGTNLLLVSASDAAGNETTTNYSVVRDEGFFFYITNPVAYQVANAPSVTVVGVASPAFLNATITVNGVSTELTDMGDYVQFQTTEPIALNLNGVTMLKGQADLDGQIYYCDPPIAGYETTAFWYQYHYDNQYSWDPFCTFNQTGIYTYDAEYHWSVATRQYTWSTSYQDDYCVDDYDYDEYDYCDVGTGSTSSNQYRETVPYQWIYIGGREYRFDNPVPCPQIHDTTYYLDTTYNSESTFVKHAPTQDLQWVLFKFQYFDYGRDPYHEVEPSEITYRGQTGFWYNGQVSFLVPIQPEQEYTVTEYDFIWPDYSYAAIDPASGGTIKEKGHWLGYVPWFSNDVLGVTLTVTNSIIPAHSPCEIEDHEWKTYISVVTSPTGFEDEVTLDITEVAPAEPDLGEGTLTQVSETNWLYEAFVEPLSELHNVNRSVKITASFRDTVMAETILQVKSAFLYLATPPYITKLGGESGAGAEYQRALNFIICKYQNCYSTITGEFSSVTISDNYSVSCPGCFCDATACTYTWDDSVVFGLGAFDGENFAASTYGHEKKHTEGIYTGECEAYTWEIDNASCTGLQGQDLTDVQNKQTDECD